MSLCKAVIVLSLLCKVLCHKSSLRYEVEKSFQEINGENGIDWISSQLESGNITLLGIRNETAGNVSLVSLSLKAEDETTKIYQVRVKYVQNKPGLELMALDRLSMEAYQEQLATKGRYNFILDDMTIDFSEITESKVVQTQKGIGFSFAIKLSQEDLCRVEVAYLKSTNAFKVMYNTCPEDQTPSSAEAAKWASKELQSQLSYLISDATHWENGVKNYSIKFGLRDGFEYDVIVQYNSDDEKFSLLSMECNATTSEQPPESPGRWRKRFELRNGRLVPVSSSKLRGETHHDGYACKNNASYKGSFSNLRAFTSYPSTIEVSLWAAQQLSSCLTGILVCNASPLLTGREYHVIIRLLDGRMCSVTVFVKIICWKKSITNQHCQMPPHHIIFPSTLPFHCGMGSTFFSKSLSLSNSPPLIPGFGNGMNFGPYGSNNFNLPGLNEFEGFHPNNFKQLMPPMPDDFRVQPYGLNPSQLMALPNFQTGPNNAMPPNGLGFPSGLYPPNGLNFPPPQGLDTTFKGGPPNNNFNPMSSNVFPKNFGGFQPPSLPDSSVSKEENMDSRSLDKNVNDSTNFDGSPLSVQTTLRHTFPSLLKSSSPFPIGNPEFLTPGFDDVDLKPQSFSDFFSRNIASTLL